MVKSEVLFFFAELQFSAETVKFMDKFQNNVLFSRLIPENRLKTSSSVVNFLFTLFVILFISLRAHFYSYRQVQSISFSRTLQLTINNQHLQITTIRQYSVYQIS